MDRDRQTAEIRRCLALLYRPGDVFEVRALDVPCGRHKNVVSGYFNDLDQAAAAAQACDERGAVGVYSTINPCDPAVLARRNNRVEDRPKATTKDAHIVRRRWLPIDVDPIRIAGVMATAEEQRAARDLGSAVEDLLRSEGFSYPLLSESGSGMYELYAIDLPNDEETSSLLESFYAALGAAVPADGANIDKTVGNASRILRIGGTWNRKGDGTTERPHRMCHYNDPIVECPVDAVSVETIRAFVSKYAPKPEPKSSSTGGGNGQYHDKLDVARYLRNHGIEFREKSVSGGMAYLVTCPFDGDHGARGESALLQDRTGMLAYICLHDSCASRRWTDYRDAIGAPGGDDYEPPRRRADAPTGERKESEPEGAKHELLPLTDTGLAERFARQHGGRVRYNHVFRKWLAWDGQRLREDDTGAVDQLAKRTVRSIFREAADEPDDNRRKALTDFARKAESAQRRAAMLALARSEPPIPIRPEELDKNDWLLNCLNGTLDLRTGVLREHRLSDGITKLCPVEYLPTATAQTWVDFLRRIFDCNEGLIGFMQRLFGCCLTGDTSEQVLPIWYGQGANGKSTAANVFQEVLGTDYAMKAAPDLLLARRHDAHPTERADLCGKRFVAAVETDDGRRLAESLVKELTGGDAIRARRMKENFWQFRPTHKVILACNHRPEVRGTDYAIWRRVRLVPFNVTIPEAAQDKHLGDKLRAELPGILAWAVRGCRDWQEQGLGLPLEIESATASYRSDEDTIGGFINGCCVTGAAYRVRAGSLYGAYKDYCERGGEPLLSQRRFGRQLTDRGYMRITNNGIWYRGLGLIDGKDSETE